MTDAKHPPGIASEPDAAPTEAQLRFELEVAKADVNRNAEQVVRLIVVCDSLRATQAELVAALRGLLDIALDEEERAYYGKALDSARAALARAEVQR